jgi:hypothetical protein
MIEPMSLLRASAVGSLMRLHSVFWQMEEDTLFAPLGETLMWTFALAEALGRTEDDPYSGLAYARSCVIHGRAVAVAGVAIQGPWSHSPLLGDAPRFTGSATARIWGFLDDPEPYDPSSGKTEKHAGRRAAYNRSVARHAVSPLIEKALMDLDVDIEAADDVPMAPRLRRP